ncbi:MAG: hypothetical protein EAZ17_00630 [Sphingobacteriales bacterium]|nr:MAG: hypothetical protein EAZ17_00630 [Sphingobacteriales bacterium]
MICIVEITVGRSTRRIISIPVVIGCCDLRSLHLDDKNKVASGNRCCADANGTHHNGGCTQVYRSGTRIKCIRIGVQVGGSAGWTSLRKTSNRN